MARFCLALIFMAISAICYLSNSMANGFNYLWAGIGLIVWLVLGIKDTQLVIPIFGASTLAAIWVAGFFSSHPGGYAIHIFLLAAVFSFVHLNSPSSWRLQFSAWTLTCFLFPLTAFFNHHWHDDMSIMACLGVVGAWVLCFD